MAISKTLTLSSGVSYAPYGELIVTETATSIPNNTSTLSIKLVLHRPYAIQSTAPKTASATINGTTHSWSGTIGGSGDLTLITKTQTVTHDSDGTKEDMSISAKIQLDVNWGGTYISTISNSGTMDLSNIPRYATSVQSLASKTETSITMNWSSDSTIDYIWYSTNDGSSWTGINVTDGKSGSYMISGLSANTTYKIKTRVRRKDSQLTTDSSMLSVATYSYPYANSMPNFTIGDVVTMGFYNPLGRTINVYIIANGVSIANNPWTISGTSYKGFDAESTINQLYATIPNAKSATYKVRVVYGSSTIEKTGGTYSVKEADCTPTIDSVSYVDVNPVSIAVTEDRSLIVQNISLATFSAEGLSAKHSASLSSVSVSVNNTTHAMSITPSGDSAVSQGFEINSGSNVIATVTVTDSRGIKATKTVTVKMAEWSIPSAIITMERHNNYYSETDITIDADWSFVDGKNSVTIQYQYKKVEDTEWSALVTTEDNVMSTFTADNLFEWNVRVIVTDRFGGTATYNKTLQIGMPIAFFDRAKESVGINQFPQNDKTLESKGLIYEEGETLSYRYGSLASHWNDNGGFADGTSIADKTWTTTATIELQAGVNLVLCYFSFSSNATGQRLMLIGNASDSTSRYVAMGHDYRNAYSGGNITDLQCAFLVNEPVARTVYMRVYQNSGTSLAGNARYAVVRLAPYQS